MTDFNNESLMSQTLALMTHYGFEIEQGTTSDCLQQWLQYYPAIWIRLAVLEALYRGRYKAVSVEQILRVWNRKGNPILNFNGDFERLICFKLPFNPDIPLDLFFPEQSPENNPTLGDSPPTFLLDQSLESVNESIELSEDAQDQSDSSLIIIAEESSEYERQATHPTPSLAGYPLSSLSLQGVDAFFKPTPSPVDESSPQQDEYSSPIEQFSPPPDQSESYLRLKILAQQSQIAKTNKIY